MKYTIHEVFQGEKFITIEEDFKVEDFTVTERESKLIVSEAGRYSRPDREAWLSVNADIDPYLINQIKNLQEVYRASHRHGHAADVTGRGYCVRAGELRLERSEHFDFRGCKTEAARDARCAKAMAVVDAVPSQELLEQAVAKMNARLHEVVDSRNRSVVENVLHIFQKGKFSEKFMDRKVDRVAMSVVDSEMVAVEAQLSAAHAAKDALEERRRAIQNKVYSAVAAESDFDFMREELTELEKAGKMNELSSSRGLFR